MNIAKKVLYGILFEVLVVGFWNLFEYIYCVFITGSGYVFTASDIIYPGVLGIVVYLVMFVFMNKKKR